jgi:putative aldouronate transport system permease protein
MVKSKLSKIGDWVFVLICALVMLVCLLPMVNLLSKSLSSSDSIINKKVTFWPVIFDEDTRIYSVGATLQSYQYVFMDASFSRSMYWTAILTVICTLWSLLMTILCAYPLTYGWLKGRGIINTIIIFTMYFSAGTIPNYILMKTLGLLNNPLVLIIPNCLSVFNMIILRSFF